MQFIMLIFSLLTTGGNDLLDYLPTADYWQCQSVEVNVDSMLKSLSPAATAYARHAGSVKQLMAIRTLGEMKDVKAVPALTALKDAKAPFVADYARQALAAINGTPYQRPGATDQALAEALGLLPANCGVAAQARGAVLFPNAGAVDFDKLFNSDETKRMPFVTPENVKQMREQFVQTLLDIAEQIGNVRLSALTFGLADNVDDNRGFLMFAGRGQYDARAMQAYLSKMMPPPKTINGFPVYSPEDQLALMPVSNDTFVFLAGPNWEELPVDGITKARQAGARGLAKESPLKTLMEAINTQSLLWLVVQVNDNYREAPPLVPLDTLTLTSKPGKDGAMNMTLLAKGKDSEAIKAQVASLKADIQEGLIAMKRAHEENTMGMGFLIKPMIAFLESIQMEQAGTTVTIKAIWKNKAMGSILLPFIMLSNTKAAR